jgi:hypothetical protein
MPCPGEAILEHQNLIGSTLPLAHQPRSSFHLRAEADCGAPGFQLECDLAELALRLRPEGAQGKFLHPVCDRSHQQIAGEVWGRIPFIETAPLLTQLADIKLGEARERLLADDVLPVGGSTDRGRRLARFLAGRGVVDCGAHRIAGAPMR